jgi:hypothetical protein
MGNMFVAVVEGLHTALRIFVILKTFNTTNSKKTPPYSAGSFNFAGTSNNLVDIRPDIFLRF